MTTLLRRAAVNTVAGMISASMTIWLLGGIETGTEVLAFVGVFVALGYPLMLLAEYSRSRRP